ncbi:peptidyl-prolyl cis-trans isomerase CYP26-2, chloroplastic isoform X2 [Cryptomeria japonica]|uniref:peptidyl-prolyl cis-trans isomerase CYP26-2, chloroplastic isoform X2 n=1 Tax=Cryptomeria japonica TaxID=3369 RepID=UPI0025AD6AF0|nr:peptidyl-prolyl cis-trans isomerase CYP26-2, chloroplastic isoform X2 [Cryptomeria japonica]
MIRQLPLPRATTTTISHDTITSILALSQPVNSALQCPKASRTWRCSARIPTAPKCCNARAHCTRRLLLQGPGLLLLSTAFCGSKKPAFAEEEEQTVTLTSQRLETVTCDELEVTKKVYLDVAIDGEAAGRIVIGLFGNDSPIGASRFAELAAGKRGVGYRKKEFVKITPSYIQNAGIRSYGVDAEIAKRSLLADELVEESVGLEKRCKGFKTFEGAVSLIVRDPSKPPSQIKLVAKGGKIEVQEEEVKPDPNGTEFVIATKSVPQLEVSTLLVGKVVDGMDVVAKMANVKGGKVDW